MSDPSRGEDLLKAWNDETLTIQKRDELLPEMKRLGLFPRIMETMDWEKEGGLYPDTDDPRFTQIIMQKQEFAENKQDSIAEQKRQGVDPCDPDKEFELTPVQRFVGRFLSPQCPYQSALLFHGVGVGKTCAAITIAENYLRSFPRKQVIIVAPRNIQPGFKRTIFDDEALVIPEDDSAPNMAKGCTGNTYLKRTATEFERDKSVVTRRISQMINSRYIFMGYIQFHRMIDDIIKRVPTGLSEEDQKAQQTRMLRREFSGRLVIIDEAHNLRSNPSEGPGDRVDNPGGDYDLSETKAGQQLAPTLEKVLNAAQGMKLVLMSGTPMYNSYREIIFLLHLLLINDKKAGLSERDVFTPTGAFKPNGEELLGAAANAYVSFMRGENPLSFPIRLKPVGVNAITNWPENSVDAKPIPVEERNRMKRLPFVPVQYEGQSMVEYQRISQEAIEAGGVGVGSIDEMVQSGNWMFPSDAGLQIRDIGFDACFEEIGGTPSQFKSKGGPPTWLRRENLGTSSSKAKFTLERAQTAKGILFIYSRFIKSGAVPLALALEANGYTAWAPQGDIRKPLLADGIQDGQGRQCALCPRRERIHTGAGHKFIPAKYILITGSSNFSPNNAVAIQAARAKTNIDGREVKIIIGSQVASEGIDFRFMREIYVFDSWFHLNKMEQVLGRGIRTCSHSLMKPEEKNCTIYLLVNMFGEGEDTETADLYMYRKAMIKAIQIGRVTRVLKRYALDCNLNRDAIVVTGLESQMHVDAQGGEPREIDINDTEYTSMCDWIETCEYDCANRVEINPDNLDTSTYDEYAVRWRESELKTLIRKLFQERKQPMFRREDILELMSAVPPRAVSALLSEIVGNQSFRLQVGNNRGYIVYRNGYFLFQPDYLHDKRIPLALRVAEVPVKRDSFDPTVITLAPLPVTEGQEVGPFWKSIKEWATAIRNGTAPLNDIVDSVKKTIDTRYKGKEQLRQKERLIMVNWLYEDIQTNTAFSPEARSSYQLGLAQALLEIVWDEEILPDEQLYLLKSGKDVEILVGREQVVTKGATTAFRIVNIMDGTIKYMCAGVPCAEAVTRIFESDTADPLNSLQANINTTGRIYGFIVPKFSEKRLVFKTSELPAQPGTDPEKGSECAIVSTIAYHIRMLKDIAEILTAEGYPKFILVDDVLNDKAMRKMEKASAKSLGKKSESAVINPLRMFEGAQRACALKGIILRWLDIMQQKRGPGFKRYFYRPIASLKTKHKPSK